MSVHNGGPSVGRYLASLGRCDPLSPEVELELCERAREGDKRAEDRLMRACLPFVVRIAFGYRAWGLPMEDLIQQGNLGLVKGYRKFEPSRGNRLLTYASYWIRAEIREYVVHNFRAVRLGTTSTERRAIRQYRKRPIESAEELAAESGMPLKRAKKLWPMLELGDVALDRPTQMGGAPIDMLEADAAESNPEAAAVRSDERRKVRRELNVAFADLDEREQYIIKARLLADAPSSLRQLGGAMGLSRERVRQIEMAGRKKLRTSLARLAA